MTGVEYNIKDAVEFKLDKKTFAVGHMLIMSDVSHDDLCKPFHETPKEQTYDYRNKLWKLKQK